MAQVYLKLFISTSVCLFSLMTCGGGGPANQKKTQGSATQNPLLVPGNLITLPATEGTVQGKVIDSNNDKVGDGLDLNGDDIREFIYIEDPESVANAATFTINAHRNSRPTKSHISGHFNNIAFYIAGNPGTIYYLVSVSGQIAIFSDGGSGGSEVLLVVSDGAIQGLDTDGDGFPDDTILEGVVPVYIGLPDHIVISEIGNSVYSSIYNDYIELYNPTDNPISLAGYYIGRDSNCTIDSGSWTEFIALPAALLPADSFYLISRNFNAIEADFTWSGSGAIQDGYCVVLTNSGLKPESANAGNVVDFVSFKPGTGEGNSEVLGSFDDGVAYGRFGCYLDTDENNYDFIEVTPDPQNSAATTLNCRATEIDSPPGNVVISEIMWDGTSSSYKDEFIELFNTTGSPVNLSNWQLVDDGKLFFTFPNGTSIVANGYVLLERQESATDVTATFVVSGINLANSGDQLLLKNNLGEVVDLAGSSGEWFAGLNSSEGNSMERIFPVGIGNDGQSWQTAFSTFSSGGKTRYGSPGQLTYTPNTDGSCDGTQSPTLVDICLASFNIQIFGSSKMNKSAVKDVILNIAKRYDALFIQELREAPDSLDNTGPAIRQFLDEMNTVAGNKYSISTSIRVGDNNAEQYVILYNHQKISVIDNFTYNDTSSQFVREPYVVRLQVGTERFYVSNVHIDPNNAVSEVEALTDVAHSLEPVDDKILLLGDLNADCGFFNETTAWPDITLIGEGYVNLIDNSWDTTVFTTTDCTYDRLLFSPALLSYAQSATARAFYFNSPSEGGFDLAPVLSDGCTSGYISCSATLLDAAKEVTDHYPVEVRMQFSPFDSTSSANYVTNFETGFPDFKKIGGAGLFSTSGCPNGTSTRSGSQAMSNSTITTSFTGRVIQSETCIPINGSNVDVDYWIQASNNNGDNNIMARAKIMWYTDQNCNNSHSNAFSSGSNFSTTQGQYIKVSHSAETPDGSVNHYKIQTELKDDNSGNNDGDDWCIDDVSSSSY